jgi:hypothetical protein
LPGATGIVSSGQPTNVAPSISRVDAGIVIEGSREFAKAHFPIFLSLDASSNVIAVIQEQFSKQQSAIVSIDDGTVNASIPVW